MKIKKVYENHSVNSVEKLINDYNQFAKDIRPFVQEELEEEFSGQYDRFTIRRIITNGDNIQLWIILLNKNGNNEEINGLTNVIELNLKDTLMKLDTKKYNI